MYPEDNFSAILHNKEDMKKKYLFVLSTGHGVTDMNQGALPAILPYLVAAGGLKYSQVAGLTFAVALASSTLQPVFGIVADRVSKSWLLAIGVLLSGCGLSLIGFFPGYYWFMFLVAIVSGIGTAAYHPEAARMANKVAGEKKGGSMSLFTVGGNIGISLGPIVATPALLYIGLRGSLVMAIPAIVMFIIFMKIGPAMSSSIYTGEDGANQIQGETKNEWKKFLLLVFAVICRSIIALNMNTFLPLYWNNVLHRSATTSGMAFSFLLFCGAVATVVGGHLADRIGITNIMKIGWIILLPTVFFFTKITDPVGAWLILIPLAFGLHMVNTPSVLLGQKYLPKNIGFASGITMGLGNSIGGVTAPFLGSYADVHGLSAALGILCFLPIAGVAIALALKKPQYQ